MGDFHNLFSKVKRVSTIFFDYGQRVGTVSSDVTFYDPETHGSIVMVVSSDKRSQSMALKLTIDQCKEMTEAFLEHMEKYD